MRRSIATVSLSGNLQEKLLAIAAAKFDSIELFENDLLFFDGTARDVRAMVEDVGLKISLFQPFRDFEGVPDEVFRRNLDRAERKFDVMGDLDAKMMLVCSNVSPAAIADDERAAAQLHELAERAAARGIRIGYEALAWGAQVKTYGHVWEIVRRAAHSHLGVILDSFHTLALGDGVEGIAHIPGEKIFFVQLADAPLLKMDVLSWSRHFRCFPGQGDFDVAAFAAKAIEAGYTGPLSLEIFNDEFRATAPSRTARDGMRSLLFLEEQIRGQLEESPAEPGRAPRPRVDLLDPPPPPDLSGVAFLEFAVDATARGELARWLEGMGFQRVGVHRGKDVTLYRQGDLAIALNAEPESFAHSYYLLHGVSVCAIGLRAADPAGLLSRAEVFGCQRFEERVGPDEAPMPGLRAPDGSLIYVVDESFDAAADFVRDRGEGASAGLVSAVDHVGQALPGDHFDTWLLFYRAVLRLKPEESWVLPDPYGLVKSRALANAARNVRFPLSFSESSRTVVARSLTTFSGAGVNQVAFSTGDIFKAVRALRKAGLELLRIPENYYDDLAARLGLDEAFVEKLRDHGVLYDRDAEGGEFLHVYTRTFHDRFFFEIVQRQGGYDQYGAANAPVRMAAQSRTAARETSLTP
ncbi:bifunctional sugar phosphate isomerase/epimerase/4-hydroxyphenylpyruvate dioxygenase family protein [Phenylobacterium soli]|uniref:3-dehydroshikimate dehydratase n=1 Tax=Phenylobacterium soli TaxID=2170551 RepID=A0A328AAT6_9CAUL|nr:sugar phosphate isomerase/epimerase and 4-hydroxyphenylpyruvate domain-containing protein [Phenylobacterium soli]RAK51802.1 4-hydroxyphenylpyruvate dioxygenase [Phenylobacterium soli]